MSQAFSAAEVTQQLTTFQRRTVDHIMECFHGADPSRRFLVADETGLGKSIVARGVVARTIEHLQDDNSIGRIDIVYVCSNQDLARQNLVRLNVTGGAAKPMSTRLTLLAKEMGRLSEGHQGGGKPVNLVSFTPGTSFSKGWQGGKAEERAMLHVVLRRILQRHARYSPAWEQGSLRLFQGGVASARRFREEHVTPLQALLDAGSLDQTILDAFERLINVPPAGSSGPQASSLLERAVALIERSAEQVAMNPAIADQTLGGGHVWDLTGELRTALSRAGVDALEPDLVILDEFQRFRELLDPGTDAGELAHTLFEHPAARVLMLSATPYKPFTFAEEEEDHEKDFLDTLRFLSAGGAGLDIEKVRNGFAAIREGARRGQAPRLELDQLSAQLRRVMTRWERPSLGKESMHREVMSIADEISTADLRGFAVATTVADLVARPKDGRLVSTEYWKSAPYFVNFCAGYKLGERLTHDENNEPRRRWDTKLSRALSEAALLTSEQCRTFQPLDPGNARMRVLMKQTVDQGWWRLPWLPPTLPYLQPRGAYAREQVQGMTKRLVFSSWNATPTAVASMLSYEAERRMADGTKFTEYSTEGRKRLARGLGYAISDGRPSRMTTLLMMWPLARLAEIGDVRKLVQQNGGHPVAPGEAIRTVAAALKPLYGESAEDVTEAEGVGRDALWRVAFNDPHNWPGIALDGEMQSLPTELRGLVDALTSTHGDRSDADEEGTGEADGGRTTAVEQHVLRALDSHSRGHVIPSASERRLLARIALFAPGCIALRVVRRLVDASTGSASTVALHTAAAVLANAVRSLFQRPEMVALLNQGKPEDSPLWEAALALCGEGNLEAVLDEWLFHVWGDRGRIRLDDESLVEFVQEASSAVALRSASYTALNPTGPRGSLTFSGGIAARYGGRTQLAEDVRQPQVRAAFNSPFRPFVLASTSVGQEGVDFHWWCHAVFHWNTPPNPVDFEQREGRVDRYHGHAVRKNIAEAHGPAILVDGEGNPWAVAYSHAQDQNDEFGFSPDWVYPGSARIERQVAPLAFSTERSTYERVKRDVAFYRVALGQPRQEDMINMLRESDLGPDALRLDLRP